MIVVVAALKGGVGKTTTCVYLAALAAAGRRAVTLVDADPQASAADWLDHADDEHFEQVELVEAPTERLLAKALQEADVVVLPTRVGGVETPGSKRCWRWCPAKCPSVWLSAQLGPTPATSKKRSPGGPNPRCRCGATSPSGSPSRPVPTVGSPSTASMPTAGCGAASCGPGGNPDPPLGRGAAATGSRSGPLPRVRTGDECQERSTYRRWQAWPRPTP